MNDRKPMVCWFHPAKLARAGAESVLAGLFGAYADPRLSQVVTRPFNRQAHDPAYDHSQEASPDGAFWFDFCADLGDGWNPTYATARLLAEPHMRVGGRTLERGRFAVLGGDQVYPTASRDEYRDRFVAPFAKAALDASNTADGAHPGLRLYAIPGNHDWYDGLNAFLGLFCGRRVPDPENGVRGFEGRRVGLWHTAQTRSYFALKLPYDWWLWAVDIQLSSYIDQGQVDYFDHVARNFMGQNQKVILCTAQPDWVHADDIQRQEPNAAANAFGNISFVRQILEKAGKGHRLRLALTGDLHHYSRYVEQPAESARQNGAESDPVHFITAGGGGAFLHPTHTLRDELRFPTQPGADQSFALASCQGARAAGGLAVYPDKDVSRRLAFNNWKFAWLNWPFTLTLCAFNALLGLMLALGSAGNGTGNEPGRVAQDLSSPFGALADAPAVAVLWVALLGILIVFADYRRRWKKWALGLAHGAIQFLGWALACSLAAASVRLLPAGSLPYWAEILALAAAIGVFGGAVFSVVFGFYLMASVLILKRHSNEAFSSLRIEDFKNLLRLELRPDGLTIHAIAVPKVPDTRRSSAGAPAEVRLIERVFLKA